MTTLPKDVLEKITNELSVRDFLKFCLGNPQCDSLWWYRRFQRDFPHIPVTKEDAKQKYLNLIKIISENAERTAEALLEHYGPVGKYLRQTKFKSNLTSQLYDKYIFIVQNIEDWNDENRLRDFIFYYKEYFVYDIGNYIIEFKTLDFLSERSLSEINTYWEGFSHNHMENLFNDVREYLTKND